VIVGPGLLRPARSPTASLSGVSVIGTKLSMVQHLKCGLTHYTMALVVYLSMDDNDGGVESAYTLTGTYNIEQTDARP